MRRTAYLFLALMWNVPAFGRAADAPPDQWIVVIAPAFREALAPLCEHRKGQGLRVAVVATTDVLTPKEIRDGDARKLADHLHKLCAETKGKSYILLVGAVEVPWHLPVDKLVVPPLKGTVGRMKGLPTDHGYGPTDADFAATVAVGRWPVRSLAEARQFVRKTLDFEQDQRPGPWRRRVTILAGNPEFNPFVDSLVEKVAMSRLDRLDPMWSGRAIFHNAQSQFCLPDEVLHERARKYVEEGQLLTLYLGHSSPEGFWAGGARYLDHADWATMKGSRGIFATFGCYGCQLVGEGGEAYGVAAVRNPTGPVAVLGSQGICFAALVHLAADGLFESVLTGTPPDRLGDGWLHLHQNLATGAISPITFRLLDAVDGDSSIPLATQRREHLEMFVLLGDPALRLPVMADKVALTVEGDAVAGGTITVRGELPKRLGEAAVRLSVERPLGSPAPGLEPLPEKPGAARAKVMLANHERANDFALLARDLTPTGGRFEVRLTLPAELPYRRLTFRAYAATEQHDGLGVLTVEVKK